MTLNEHLKLMESLNKDYHRNVKSELLGKQCRELQKKWREVTK